LDLQLYPLNKNTSEYYFDHYHITKVCIKHSPYYVFAKAIIDDCDDDEYGAAESFFRGYLRAVTPQLTDGAVDEHVKSFQQMLHSAQENEGSNTAAILTRLTSNGEFFIVDGIEQVSIAAALGLKSSFVLWPIDLAFMRYSPVAEFYGTSHNDRPYQSIYYKQKIIIPGRREDTIERLKLIPSDILTGARIVDVASNFGMSSILAYSLGAKSVLGLEISSDMVDIASRFAMHEGAFPNVQFRQFNIDHDNLSPNSKFDIGFMFSIWSHLAQPEKLIHIAKHHVEKYVVFEAHPGGQYGDYKQFFESGLFTSVDEIGCLSRSVFIPEKNRTLWLCKR